MNHTVHRPWARLSPLNLVPVVLVVLLLSVTPPRVASSSVPARCPGSPNQCSLHGTCAINRQGEYVCNCQWGYHGADCAKKMCPYGFDPTSPFQEEKKLRLTIGLPGATLPPDAASVITLHGKFVVTFHAHSVEFETPLHEVTSDACTAIFQRFQNLADVSCQRIEFAAPASATYEITLHSFPVYPIMNNLFHHNGNPLSTEFWCDASAVRVAPLSAAAGSRLAETLRATPVACAFESVTDRHVKEYAACSNHGVCSDRTGLCTCEHGFYGDNCGNTHDAEDMLVASAPGPFFQGNVLRVSAARGASTEFNLVKADIGGSTVLTMNGQGDTVLHRGSLQLKQGDLLVQDGSLRVQNGGAVALENADLRVHNGRVLVQAAMATASGVVAPLLELELLTPAATDFVRLSRGPSAPVLRVTSAGTVVVHDGGLEVLSGGLDVHAGGLRVRSDGVQIARGGLDVQHGGVTVRDGNVSVLGGQLRAKSASAAALALETAAAPFLSATREGEREPAFEVLASGETRIQGGGLRVGSGGVHVAAGGVQVAAGGLHVASGDVRVDAGELVLAGGLRVDDGGLRVQTRAANGAALQLSAPAEHFAGALLELLLPPATASATTPVPFHLLNAKRPSQQAGGARTSDASESVFSVDGDGAVRTRGDISTLGRGRIVSAGALVSQAQVVFGRLQLAAAPTLEIPSSHSYVQVTSDGSGSGSGTTTTTATTGNRVRLDTTAAFAGQLLVIQNEDEQALEGDVSVKPQSAAIFVFDGQRWRALTAASFDTSELSGVQRLEAANDLHVGDVRLSARSLQAGGQPAGFVAVYGKGGELSHHDKLQFDAASATLSLDKLEAHTLIGKIDMSDSELRGVEIVGGHISSVNLTDLEVVEVAGELFVEEQAYFGASITVDGQVMGSGAYIDASDARFKRNVEPLAPSEAAAAVSRLAGVSFEYRVDEFPQRGFGARRELGFIAQHVERVLPEVVGQDADGFKFVAYARVVPVLVEALKHEQRERQALQARVEAMQRQLEALTRWMERETSAADAE
ncbi:hypothetical protein ATCC90586_009529 [Pythium insidiosum]|nr:hypothetical protein ATCC90586_009529 [Pythium insidiosum]